MTDLEKLQIKQEILAELKADALKVSELPNISTVIDLDEIIVEHGGRTYKAVVSSLPNISGGNYTDLQARAAMGAKANNNPLNHDRYTNAEALSASINDVSTTLQGWTASKLITQLNNKSDINHIHDDIYFTEIELSNQGSDLIGINEQSLNNISGQTLQDALESIDGFLTPTQITVTTFLDGWTGTLYYSKDVAGWVSVFGELINSGAGITNIPLVLPVGYRPSIPAKVGMLYADINDIILSIAHGGDYIATNGDVNIIVVVAAGAVKQIFQSRYKAV